MRIIIFVLMQKEVNAGIHLCFSYLFLALMKWCGNAFLKIQAFCILKTKVAPRSLNKTGLITNLSLTHFFLNLSYAAST
jgi:hypothetical protein